MSIKKNKPSNRLNQSMREERGSIVLLSGLLIVLILALAGLAIDFGQAAGFHRKLQQAADIGVREIVRGKDPTQVTDLICSQVQLYVDCSNVNVTTRENDDIVTLRIESSHDNLFGNLYRRFGGASAFAVSVEAQARKFCSAPDNEESRWQAKTESCPAGQTGLISFEQEQTRHTFCASETANVNWSEWQDTQNKRNVVNTCQSEQASCSSVTERFRWSETREIACEPGTGQGLNLIQVRQVSRASCPEYQDNPVWSDWEDVVPAQTQPVSNSCTAKCSPVTQERWVSRTRSKWCPGSGINGTETFLMKQERNSWCNSDTRIWNEWWDANVERDHRNNCAYGGKSWTTPGTYNWVVPEGVTKISVLAIGGGASGTIAGTSAGTFRFSPGGNSTVNTGQIYVSANGGGSSVPKSGEFYMRPGNEGGCGGAKQGGYCGGNGGEGRQMNVNGLDLVGGGGGGGGGGYYFGNGHGAFNRAWNNDSPASGGGGGGGNRGNVSGGGGGGVGIYGYSSDGQPGGRGGSNGTNGGAESHVLNTVSRVIAGAAGGSAGGGGGGVPVIPTDSAVDLNRGFAGGGGELSYWNLIPVTPGASVSVIVGAGGASQNYKAEIGGVAFDIISGEGGSGAVRFIWGTNEWGGDRIFPQQNTGKEME